ncbi:MAG: hypothetical protein KDA61_05270, partial [Planctomycetales bacterium]|nr:hypothetical protein [Planctomycetales bacterium]
LSYKLRTALTLVAIEQMSPSEAAKLADCSTATMHWRVHQARKQLRKLLRGRVTL